jgi:hypothetical protein
MPNEEPSFAQVGPIAGGLIADCEQRSTNRLLLLVRYDEDNGSRMQQTSARTPYSDFVVP